MVLVAAIVVFLWTPLTTADGIYGPGDSVQNVSLLRTAPDGYRVGNSGMGDAFVQYLPWHTFNRQELSDGRLPTWNPDNGSGVPHLANAQSAVFSPFSVFYDVLPIRWATLGAAFAQLFVGGMLMYGFLRHVGTGFLGAVVGMLAFAFCGSSVIWLFWPLSDAAALVPGMAWAASALVRQQDHRRRAGPAAGLAAATAVSWLAGHPETTFFACAIAAVVGGVHMERTHGRRSLSMATAWLVGALGLGAGIAAVQLLPLAEYLDHSMAVQIRGAPYFLPWDSAALHTLPFVAGSPAHEYSSTVLDWPAYVEVGGVYVGATVLFLAGVGAVIAARSRPLRPARLPLACVALASVWVLYAYDVAGFGHLVHRLPGADAMVVARSVVVWQFALAVLAAFGVDRLRAAGDRPPTTSRGAIRRRQVALVGGGALVVAASWWMGARLRDEELPTDPATLHLAWQTAREHMLVVFGLLTVGVAGAVALVRPWGERRLVPLAAACALVGSVLLQGAVVTRHFNPTVARPLWYSSSDEFDEIRSLVGREQTMWLGDAHLFPDVNLAYGVSSPGTYDAIWLESYFLTYRDVIGPRDSVYALLGTSAQPRGVGNLRAMGIRYVVTGPGEPFPTVPGLRLVAESGRFQVFEVPRSPTRYFSPAQVVEGGPAMARRRMSAPDFDPLAESIVGSAVEDGEDGEDGEAGDVEVVEESPSHVRLRVTRDDLGWMIAIQNRYPGWRATVDGEPVPVSTANATFMAVPVPAGASEVVLSYRPTSLRLGALVSLLSTAAVVALLAWSRSSRPIAPWRTSV